VASLTDAQSITVFFPILRLCFLFPAAHHRHLYQKYYQQRARPVFIVVSSEAGFLSHALLPQSAIMADESTPAPTTTEPTPVTTTPSTTGNGLKGLLAKLKAAIKRFLGRFPKLPSVFSYLGLVFLGALALGVSSLDVIVPV
jgi:hypothetical protein